MLSVVDLIAAGTMDVPLTSWLLAAISRGNSFIVGANPGGAGKTTVMAALLNFIPADMRLMPLESEHTVRQAARTHELPTCWICHEIGDGPYYAYLWGPAVGEMLRLARPGLTVASNLHADTLEQCRSQICQENGVAQGVFDSVPLLLFMHVARSGYRMIRRIATAYEAAAGGHRLVWRWDERTDRFEQVAASDLVTRETVTVAEQTVRALLATGVQTIEQVRRFILDNAADVA